MHAGPCQVTLKLGFVAQSFTSVVNVIILLGQNFEKQNFASLIIRFPSQLDSPFRQDLYREMVPSPHVALHVDQGDQGDPRKPVKQDIIVIIFKAFPELQINQRNIFLINDQEKSLT